LLVWQGGKYVAAPQQLRHRDRKSPDEFVAQRMTVGHALQRLTLER